jgi:hypothetical protein
MTNFRISQLVTLSLAMATGACTGREANGSTNTAHASRRSTGYVDSIFPPEEALRRFRRGLPEVSTLSEASPSRDALIRRFVRAVESSDTTAIRAMVLNRAEFAYLYYPPSSFARRPYLTSPALLWFLTQQNSEKGITRLLRRYGGRPLGFVGFECEPEPSQQGENKLWQACAVRFTNAAGDTLTRRLFGAIIERAGRYKFVSYANDL